jgi:hypothetical protein
VGCFFIEKQKVVLFPTYRKNGWESAASALSRAYNLLTQSMIREFNKKFLD